MLCALSDYFILLCLTHNLALAFLQLQVRAVRNGREVQLRSSSVLVGDLLLVETGDILCADGVLVAGADIKVDESHLTGEADDVSKDPTSAQALYGGSKVVSGFGKMLVTAVGQRSQSGSIASMIAAAAGGQEGATLETGALTLPTEGLGRLREETALQRKLAGYAATIGQVGLGAAVLATVALAGRFTYDTFLLAHLPWDWAYLHAYLNFFITGVTILVRVCFQKYKSRVFFCTHQTHLAHPLVSLSLPLSPHTHRSWPSPRASPWL